jgi:hypothetical protein
MRRLLIVLPLLLLLAACGAQPASKALGPDRLVLRAEVLPSSGIALMGGAAASLDGQMLLLGGLEGDVSQATIWRFTPGQTLAPAGSLPAVSHDHAALRIGSAVWLFGGGNAYGPLASLVRIGPDLSGREVGTLPRPSSDLAAVPYGQGALVIGGYDGTSFNRDVLLFNPVRQRLQLFAVLPEGLRYTAAATVGGALYLAGGLTPTGDTNAIVKVVKGRAEVVGHLPVPLQYAGAFAYGGRLYVVGGEDQTQLLHTVYSFNPADDSLRLVLRLPLPYAYGYLFPTKAGRIYLVDGLAQPGQAGTAVQELILRRIRA